MSNGLWVSPTEYQAFAETIPSAKEIVTAETVKGFSASMGYLPNPDEVLQAMGEKIDVYKKLLYDAKVRSSIGQLTAGVKSLEWDVERGRAKARVKKEIEEWLKDFDLPGFIEAHVMAWCYGYQPMEAPWKDIGGRWYPGNFVAKPPEWFVYNPAGHWAFLTKSNPREGEPIDPETRNFIFPSFDASYENPYGIGALSGCFWPVTFKRGGLKFWLLFTEKFGMPHVVMKVASSATDDERAKALAAGKRMIQDAVLVINDSQSYEFVEAGGKGASADLYRGFAQYNDDQIALSIIHQTMSSDVSDKGGGYASSKTGEAVLTSATFAVARAVEYSLSRIMGWIARVNWDSADAPSFVLYPQSETGKEEAERDTAVNDGLKAIGKRLSQRYFQKRYYLDDEDIEDAPAEMPAPAPAPPPAPAEPGTDPGTEPGQKPAPSFAEGQEFPDQADVDRFAEDLSDEQLQEQMEETLQPVFTMIAKAGSYAEAQRRLLELYPKMETGSLEKVLAEGMYRATILGRIREGQ